MASTPNIQPHIQPPFLWEENPAPGSFILHSESSSQSRSGQSIFGWHPKAIFWVTPKKVYFREQNKTYACTSRHPLEVLQSHLENFGVFKETSTVNHGKIVCGFFSYEFSQFTLNLPQKHNLNFFNSTNDFPLAWFGFYDDALRLPTHHFRHSFPKAQPLRVDLKSNQSQRTFQTNVERIIRFIGQGDIYQANYSQRFSAPWGGQNLFPLFQALQHHNPAPFSAFLKLNTHNTIVCASPERFFRLKNRRIETHPIKGTIARGQSPSEDKINRRTLKKSEKDRAELTMIVDLERNDLGKICETGSVDVPVMGQLHSFASVHHLIAQVQGTLRTDQTLNDILHALFPGGSITGAPKIRAMEIISRLEKTPRDIYTGSIGYFAPGGVADFNIAIRTLWSKKNKIFVSSGSGIIAESNPETEYLETLQKIKPFFKLLTSKENFHGHPRKFTAFESATP